MPVVVVVMTGPAERDRGGQEWIYLAGGISHGVLLRRVPTSVRANSSPCSAHPPQGSPELTRCGYTIRVRLSGIYSIASMSLCAGIAE